MTSLGDRLFKNDQARRRWRRLWSQKRVTVAAIVFAAIALFSSLPAPLIAAAPVNVRPIPVQDLPGRTGLEVEKESAAMAVALPTAADNRGGEQLHAGFGGK